ncbi:sulfurtransferase-like selenium metabolism protein YedF [Zhenpiania hominis]|uniref:Sulfurtransferase-like selenium metabolism protein YedF n=1 Tax=Zhenpiania hominis TaxID=2763644 RepID=A0A923NFY3_9FIRM|nr:sulfurtransferase-like selenium metabolism protein YedF [Zhenpiania hominis]MBC6678243.1 sulfurtransferase-like selenium metabolism protein YedF [Zhenpiania hominis]
MNEKKKIAILVTADTFGSGSEELGQNLMKSYIYSLTEAEEKPSVIMFLNRGVYLTTTGSPVLESLKQLEQVGTEILSCGACLNFYKLEEALEVGEVTNMYYNVELMHSAERIITVG